MGHGHGCHSRTGERRTHCQVGVTRIKAHEQGGGDREIDAGEGEVHSAAGLMRNKCSSKCGSGELGTVKFINFEELMALMAVQWNRKGSKKKD
jgi:hypothetical protein